MPSTTMLQAPRLSSADVDLMCSYIYKMGGYGLGLFHVMDLGLPRELFERHLNESIDNLKEVAAGGDVPRISIRPPGSTNRALMETVNEIWDYPQTLRFAAGTTIIGQYYKKWMKEENLRQALAAKVLYNCSIQILDDLIDKGDYNYIEAKELTHLVLSSMFNPAYEERVFVKKLVSSLREGHIDYRDLIMKFTTSFNSLMGLSPHGGDYFYHMDVYNQRLVLVQALSMFQKAEGYNLGKVKRVASQFYAPAEDLQWHDKLANAFSGGILYNLLDMSFCERKFNPSRLRNFLRAWWYFDTVVTYLISVVTVYDDLRHGIVNTSLMAMREKEVLEITSPKGYEPGLTREDYEGHLRWAAELARRGLALAAKDVGDPDGYFPFLAVVMPLILMAEAVGTADEMIRFYLNAITPAVRHAVEHPVGAKGRALFPHRPRLPVKS